MPVDFSDISGDFPWFSDRSVALNSEPDTWAEWFKSFMPFYMSPVQKLGAEVFAERYQVDYRFHMRVHMRVHMFNMFVLTPLLLAVTAAVFAFEVGGSQQDGCVNQHPWTPVPNGTRCGRWRAVGWAANAKHVRRRLGLWPYTSDCWLADAWVFSDVAYWGGDGDYAAWWAGYDEMLPGFQGVCRAWLSHHDTSECVSTYYRNIHITIACVVAYAALAIICLRWSIRAKRPRFSTGGFDKVTATMPAKTLFLILQANVPAWAKQRALGLCADYLDFRAIEIAFESGDFNTRIQNAEIAPTEASSLLVPFQLHGVYVLTCDGNQLRIMLGSKVYQSLPLEIKCLAWLASDAKRPVAYDMDGLLNLFERIYQSCCDRKCGPSRASVSALQRMIGDCSLVGEISFLTDKSEKNSALFNIQDPRVDVGGVIVRSNFIKASELLRKLMILSNPTAAGLRQKPDHVVVSMPEIGAEISAEREECRETTPLLASAHRPSGLFTSTRRLRHEHGDTQMNPCYVSEAGL